MKAKHSSFNSFLRIIYEGKKIKKFQMTGACKSNCVNISNSYYAERSIYEEKRKA